MDHECDKQTDGHMHGRRDILTANVTFNFIAWAKIKESLFKCQIHSDILLIPGASFRTGLTEIWF